MSSPAFPRISSGIGGHVVNKEYAACVPYLGMKPTVLQAHGSCVFMPQGGCIEGDNINVTSIEGVVKPKAGVYAVKPGATACLNGTVWLKGPGAKIGSCYMTQNDGCVSTVKSYSCAAYAWLRSYCQAECCKVQGINCFPKKITKVRGERYHTDGHVTIFPPYFVYPLAEAELEYKPQFNESEDDPMEAEKQRFLKFAKENPCSIADYGKEGNRVYNHFLSRGKRNVKVVAKLSNGTVHSSTEVACKEPEVCDCKEFAGTKNGAVVFGIGFTLTVTNIAAIGVIIYMYRKYYYKTN